MTIFQLLVFVFVAFLNVGVASSDTSNDRKNPAIDLQTVAESTLYEDEKFASDIVAAHQVEAAKSSKNKNVDHNREKQQKQKQTQKKTKRNKKYSHMKGPYSCFRTVEGTLKAMDDIASRHPTLAKVVTIGKSYAGSDMKVLILTEFDSDDDIEKGKMFITFGLHARELAPPELGLRWAEYLTSSYAEGTDADVTQVLIYNEIHLLLQSNPDGRKIAEKNPSLGNGYGWRKNAHAYPAFQSSGQSGCPDDSPYGIKSADKESFVYGIDLNRNFPFHFGGNGGSTNPCDDNYQGPAKYSPEPETQAIIEYAKSIFPIKQQRSDGGLMEALDEDTTTGLYLDIHSSGKTVSMPWLYSKNTTAPNFEQLMALSRKFCSFNQHKPLASGTNEFWYEVSGSTQDYMYASMGLASYTFEIGQDQAENCKYFEKIIVSYNFNALLYGAKASRAPFHIPKGPDVTRLALSQSNSSLLVEIEVSDSHRTYVPDKRGISIFDRYTEIPSGYQAISAINIFIDEHPYGREATPYDVITMEMSAPTKTVNFTIEETDNLGEGKHMICVQAIDVAHYAGAVSCEFLNIGSSFELVPRCDNTAFFFSLKNDTGSWVTRSMTCQDVNTNDTQVCDRRVKFEGSTLVRDICPGRCSLNCLEN